MLKLCSSTCTKGEQTSTSCCSPELRPTVKAGKDKYPNTYKSDFSWTGSLCSTKPGNVWGLQASLCVIKYFINEQQTHLIGQEVTSDSDLQDKQTSRILRSEQSFDWPNEEFAVLPDFRYPLDFRWHKQGTWLFCTQTQTVAQHTPSFTDFKAPDAASTFRLIPQDFAVTMSLNGAWRVFQFSHHWHSLQSERRFLQHLHFTLAACQIYHNIYTEGYCKRVRRQSMKGTECKWFMHTE